MYTHILIYARTLAPTHPHILTRAHIYTPPTTMVKNVTVRLVSVQGYTMCLCMCTWVFACYIHTYTPLAAILQDRDGSSCQRTGCSAICVCVHVCVCVYVIHTHLHTTCRKFARTRRFISSAHTVFHHVCVYVCVFHTWNTYFHTSCRNSSRTRRFVSSAYRVFHQSM